MRDQTLYCVQCDNPFTFTSSEQKRANAQGFDAPKRCPECRKHKQKSKDSENRRKKRSRREVEPWEIAEDED
ncbi:MAG: zinc-ribbon domain-containing protein [Deltaproteobacteria bacterium]|nr:zinc-ribbon domain-containing protein [Deltaproteobacteria bacterium]